MPPHPSHRFVDPTGPHNVSTVRPPKWHTLSDPLDSFAVAIIVERGEPARRRSDYLEAVERQLGEYLALYPFEGYDLGENGRRDLARRIVDEELKAGGGLNVYRGLVLHHLEAMLGKPGPELEEALERIGQLPEEGTRTLQAWTPGAPDERDDLDVLVTADDGVQLVLSYDLDGEGHTRPDDAVTVDRPGDLVELGIAAADALLLGLLGGHANGLHLAEGITGVQLLDRLATLEAAVARLRPVAEVWAAGERKARAAFVSSDPWTTPGPVPAPPF